MANPRYLAYHDHEWGVPCHDENRAVRDAQPRRARRPACRWETILNKRDTYRAAFDGWDAEKIAATTTPKVAELLANPGIVRNRLKVAAAITNAQAYLRLRAEGLTLDQLPVGLCRRQADCRPWPRDGPARQDELSDRISKDLAKRGFKFVGSTIVYAYMQGIGMVTTMTELLPPKNGVMDWPSTHWRRVVRVTTGLRFDAYGTARRSRSCRRLADRPAPQRLHLAFAPAWRT
jgi:DNA-3-methyladenine glycosylase I